MTQEKYWKINVIESERGWGSKVEDVYYFKTREDAEKFELDYNKSNVEDYQKTKQVPDWYMQAEDPVEVNDYKTVTRLNELWSETPDANKFHRDALKDSFWDDRR